MILITCLVLLIIVITLLFVSGWIPVIYIRARLKALGTTEPSTNIAGMTAYRTPDPQNAIRLETYDYLTERLAHWELRRKRSAVVVQKGGYAALMLATLVVGGMLARWSYVHKSKDFDVKVKVIDKFWFCEVGNTTEDGGIRVYRWILGTTWSWGRPDVASCPLIRESGIHAVRLRYYTLMESETDCAIVRRGERFILLQDDATYRRMRVGGSSWRHKLSGGRVHNVSRPFFLRTPQGAPWPVR